MANQKLISFDLKAEFGFFKKPDINDGLFVTYNMLHKPILLGILGAILGMKGYEKNGEMPEYYAKLKHLKIGIQPLLSDKGNFTKEMVSYNNGTGLATNANGGNLIITEQILINPSYRCFLLLDLDKSDEKTLYKYIMSYKAEFLPYLGKNDFSAWWENAEDTYSITKFDFSSDFKIVSIFKKTEAISGCIVKSMSICDIQEEANFVYFEKLPTGFNETLFQYEYGDFVYANTLFKKEINMHPDGIFYKITKDKTEIIQLF
ncbi:MAG: type I-B CRISPR-associated protein Cas5b [Bacteroidales bacterium]